MFFASATFTWIHVILSLIGIASGLAVASALLNGDMRSRWTATFLATTLATSVTGFLFPFDTFLPSHWVGVISLLVLAPALFALYLRKLGGAWRSIYVVTALAALYLNVFVLVVQIFRKVPALHALAPTESEPPFAIVQGLVLIGFVALGYLVLRGLRSRGALPA